MIEWHKILGNALRDYFSDTCYSVGIDRELKIKQFIDILVIEEHEGKKSDDSFLKGLENLSKYNVITYKSLRQPLDSWALDELTSYYVLFRKMVSPDQKRLLPEEEFKLYGISTRFPEKLNKQESLENKGPGIYEIRRGSKEIEILVICEMPKEARTALWHIFSTKTEMIEYGLSEYKWKREDYKKLVFTELIMKYQEEGIKMSYTEQDFKRDVALDTIGFLRPEERLRGLQADEILRNLKPKDRLKGLRPEQRLEGLQADQVLKNFGAEELLKCLSAEEIKAYLRRIEKEDTY